MFTGFASENTPAIQVWDLFNPYASTAAVRSVFLPDDCAPIQMVRTGATTTAIRLYLPTAPIEGKQITIVNQRYGGSSQSINIYSSDVSGFGTGSDYSIVTLGQGDSIVLVYSKQGISFGTSSGYVQTGWLLLNRASAGAANSFAAVVGGGSNSASGSFSFIGGGNSSTASSTNAAVVGGNGNTASGGSSAAVGGSGNTASGPSAAVIGGSSNSATQNNGFVGGGSSNTANGSGASAVGGTGLTASGSWSGVFSGVSGTASGAYSIVVGGNTNTANAANSIVIGGASGIARSIIGNFVTPASNSPISSFPEGQQQAALLILGRQTTDATATRLTSNTNAAGTTNQVILPNNSAYAFEGTCIANVTGGGNTSGWKFEGVIKRGANAASTALVAAVTPLVIAQDAGAVTWVLAITADTTNGGIAVTVTGAAATTIRWVAKIETTEVTF